MKSLSISSLRKARKESEESEESEESDKVDHGEAKKAWEELHSVGTGVVNGSYRERVEKPQHEDAEHMGVEKSDGTQTRTV